MLKKISLFFIVLSVLVSCKTLSTSDFISIENSNAISSDSTSLENSNSMLLESSNFESSNLDENEMISLKNSYIAVDIAENAQAKQELEEKLNASILLSEKVFCDEYVKLGSQSSKGTLTLDFKVEVSMIYLSARNYSQSYSYGSGDQMVTGCSLDHAKLIINGQDVILPYEENVEQEFQTFCISIEKSKRIQITSDKVDENASGGYRVLLEKIKFVY